MEHERLFNYIYDCSDLPIESYVFLEFVEQSTVVVAVCYDAEILRDGNPMVGVFARCSGSCKSMSDGVGSSH